MSNDSQQTRHDPFQAWRYPAFGQYAVGSALVQVGAAAQSTAISWEMWVRTGDAFALGMVALVLALPMLVGTIPAGFLADRLDRRWLVLASMVGTTITSLLLAAVSYARGDIYLIYLLLFLDASSLTLGRPARTAFQTQLVPREAFENAMKWRSTLFQISAVAGPAIGGLLLTTHRTVPYFFAASTSILFMVFLLVMRVRPSTRTGEPMTLKSVLAGAEFIFQHKTLLAAVSLDLFAVLLGGAVYLLPIYAKNILDIGETGHGLLRAAPAVGALIMGLTLAILPPMRNSGRNMLLAVAGFGVATIVFGLSRNPWLSWAMLFLTGALDNISVVVRHTLVQLITPDHMRGRVSAANTIFIGSSNELGGLESGVVARLTTPTISVVSGGIGTVIVVVAVGLLAPTLRRVGLLSEEAEASRKRLEQGPPAPPPPPPASQAAP